MAISVLRLLPALKLVVDCFTDERGHAVRTDKRLYALANLLGQPNASHLRFGIAI